MVDNQGLAQHHASVTVNAPVHQVYGLYTHFNDFPKFMTFVKEVTYYDNQRSHWVAQAVATRVGCRQRQLDRGSPDRLAFNQWPGKQWARHISTSRG